MPRDTSHKPVLLLHDPLCLEHDPGDGHPESAARLAEALRSLREEPVAGTVWAAPRDASDAELAAVHTPEHLARLAATVGRARSVLDPDTIAGPRSFAAARRAAGAVLSGVDAVLADEARGAFAIVRPPGHHAEADAAMGFCLVNHAAIAAEHALANGCARVAILDPDVHHGNGTQHIFETRAEVLYVSSHRWPFYPGTGAASEVGHGAGAGATLNLPLQAGMGDAELLTLWRELAAPVIDDFAPELILVSAGFDTWEGDPLGGLAVSADGFAALWALYRQLADRHCPGRLVGVLEGGYAAEGVAAGVRSAAAALADGPPDSSPRPRTNSAWPPTSRDFGPPAPELQHVIDALRNTHPRLAR